MRIQIKKNFVSLHHFNTVSKTILIINYKSGNNNLLASRFFYTLPFPIQHSNAWPSKIKQDFESPRQY